MVEKNSFYVTTPIYYVNDKPHIGHAYTTILADVLARYERLLEQPTFFLTGTDEHGQKVAAAAAENGISPLQQCDRTVVRFQELWNRLEITCNDFIRTTEPRHTNVVRSVMQNLYDRDEIYAADYEGWYCVGCERFYTEKDLKNQKCPDCERPVEKLVERNYFFRMSKYRDWLISYIKENPNFIQPEHRRQETLGFLRQPLNDLCVSRPKTRMGWGIELPFDNEYVTYVWFDALINYLTGIGYQSDNEMFERWWPASFHLIGKDILTTHTVYWPTMLQAMGLEMPKTIFAHGWWLVGRSKMSKSLGNVVNPMDMIDLYGVDAFRYFLMAEMTLGQDASFTEDIFVTRYNADLANDLGNFVSRVLKMIQRNADGRIPPRCEPTAAESELVSATLAAVQHMEKYIDSMQLDRGLAEVMNAVREGNRYFEQTAPWKLAKAGDKDALQRVLYSAAESLRIVSGLLYPVMPGKMSDLRRALGLAEVDVKPKVGELAQWGGLEPGLDVQKLAALFPRVNKTDKPATAKSKPAAAAKNTKAQKQKTNADGNLVDISEFAKLALKTAKVMAAEPVEGTDKLLRLQIDVGGEKRQIVAGIAQCYNADELVGKNIVVVANLKPATIKGIKSQGMLLAAKTSDKMRLITVDADMPSGAAVG